MNRAVSMSRPKVARDRRRATRAGAVAALCVVAAAIVSIAASRAVAQPTPRPIPTEPPRREGAPSLPTLGAEKTTIDVRGKILHSTRGRPGPVRLQVERSDDPKPLEVLVAPNEVCDKLGLSLKPGEMVHLRGALFAGKNPMFVASAVVVDGKPIALRSKTARSSSGKGAASGDESAPASSH